MHRCFINRIEENIYLSDWEGASNLDFINELKITKIISLGNEKEQEFYEIHENIEYLKIIIDDSENANISQYFNETNKFISQGTVLIHCNKGISRSVTIIMAYLIDKGMSYSEAFNKIQNNRHFIKPNSGFIEQLKFVCK